MKKINLELLELALRKSWSRQTCFRRLKEDWSPDNPAVGQCTVTALVVQDCFGGKILYCKHHTHCWNKLPDGREIDITRGQFTKNVKLCADRTKYRKRLLGFKSVLRRYMVLKQRVECLLNRKTASN